MAIHSDNLNLNLNLNLGASVGAGGGGATGYGRPRFNTEDMDKLMPDPAPTTWPIPEKEYAHHWDAELRAWAFVEEFIMKGNWSGDSPIDAIYDDINNFAGDPNEYPRFMVPLNTAKVPLDDAGMADQIVGVVNASLDRADRAMEILDQATGAGALNYWTGLLRIDPVQERRAFLLMLVARKIGEYVAMGLKDRYLMRRPSQVYPLILPLIDPPDTPSFPSSHSLQAHLISGALKLALKNTKGQTAIALDALADRVARNREIAGVHYGMDTDAGAYAAEKCLDRLKALDSQGRFQRLLKHAKEDLSDLQ